MATMFFSYTEGEDEGLPFTRKVAVERTNVDDLYNALDFVGEALRAAGFTYVDRVGISTERGEQKWGTF